MVIRGRNDNNKLPMSGNVPDETLLSMTMLMAVSVICAISCIIMPWISHLPSLVDAAIFHILYTSANFCPSRGLYQQQNFLLINIKWSSVEVFAINHPTTKKNRANAKRATMFYNFFMYRLQVYSRAPRDPSLRDTKHFRPTADNSMKNSGQLLLIPKKSHKSEHARTELK